MFYWIFLSPQVTRCAIITDKHGKYVRRSIKITEAKRAWVRERIWEKSSGKILNLKPIFLKHSHYKTVSRLQQFFSFFGE